MFQVRGWTAAYGATYEAALMSGGGKVGKSTIMRVDTGDPTVTPAGTPASLVRAGLNAFAIMSLEGGPCVLEPRAWCIALLGSLVVLFRQVRR